MAMFTLTEPTNSKAQLFFAKWFPRAIYLAGGISVFIAFVLTENFVASSVFFNALSNFVGSVVPAIFRVSSMTAFPATTAAIFSVNWLMTPIYFLLLVSATPFWKEAFVREKFAKLKMKNPITIFAIGPLFLVLFILSDVGLIEGFGIFSMAGYKSLTISIYLKLLLATPIGTMLLLWGLCAFEAFVYWYVLVLVGGFSIQMLRLLIRKINLLKHSHV